MYRRFARRPRRKIIRRRIARKPKVSSRIKRYVKNQIHRNIENKEIIDYGANQSVVVNTTATQSRPMYVPVTVGTGSSNRTGNEIKVVQGYMDLTVNLMNYNATTNPYPKPTWVKIWVVRDLQTQAQKSELQNTSKFFRGNGTTLNFQNNTLDICLPINQDWFRVLYQKTFKLGIAGSGVVENGSILYDNGSACKKLRINWGKYFKSALKYDDSASNNYPINQNLYFVIQAVPADGSSTASGASLVEFHYVNVCKYEDA